MREVEITIDNVTAIVKEHDKKLERHDRRFTDNDNEMRNYNMRLNKLSEKHIECKAETKTELKNLKKMNWWILIAIVGRFVIDYLSNGRV